MRVHTSVLTANDLITAALHAEVVIHQLTEHGSRSRKRAYDFYLEGSGVTGGQWGGVDQKMATWDEYGIFLARLYTKDPDAHFGKGSYQCEAHFHWVTGDRYRTLTPDQQHLRHRWTYQGTAATRAFHVHSCTGCTAILRVMAQGHAWEDLA